MRIAAIHLLTAATFALLGACSSGENTDASSSTVSAPATNPQSADEPAAASGQTESMPSAAAPQVSRTRAGNGGIIGVAGQMTMEFDYSPPQGLCRASDGKLSAKGIDIDDDKAGVTIKYETVVAPDTGRTVGYVLNLEVRKDGYVRWVTNVGSGQAGSVDDIAQELLPGGGTTLSVTGTMAGFNENRAPTGTKAPFRLEVTCGL
jgi:hypothetical protein